MYCSNCGKESPSEAKFCAHCGVSLAPGAAAIVSNFSIYAGFWRRFAAFIIDSLAVYAAGTVLWVVLLAVGSSRIVRPYALLALMVFSIGSLLYWVLFESSGLQATPGKLALQIKVTDLLGDRISFGRSLGRNVARIFSGMFFCIGYMAAGFTQRRQAFHDMIASTLVVRKSVTPAEAAGGGGVQGSSGALIAIFAVVLVVVGIAFIGILAAIAIPAYQNYTIRAQVTEGLMLAEPYKAAVSRAIASGTRPAGISSDSLQITAASSGTYVDIIKVVAGAVAIKYGKSANTLIRDHVLVIYPALDGNQSVVWICGRAAVPGGTTPTIKDAARYTNVGDAYLPSACHR
jgi:uncharacterized RDD family membrane protein YckC/Tfp pilus assembly major pilin PilA